MIKHSRTFFAMRNALVTGLVTILNFPIQFINRYYMVHYLGIVYLGLTSLFTNILSVLSLADLGLGTSIVFLLYKPLSERNFKKIAVIMKLYRNIYYVIAIVIFLIGLGILPFLKYLVGRNINYPHIYILFIIYLTGSATSYLFSYNQSLLYADQKNHIVAWTNLVVTYIMLTLQVITVLLFKNPLLYAFLFVFSSFVTNIIVTVFVNHIYHLRQYNNGVLNREEIYLLKKNVVGNMFLRISGVIVTGTDNIFLSSFAGVVSVGLYSNYLTITNVLQRIMTQVISAVTGSIGNFITQNKSLRSKRLFFNLQFINFILVSMISLGIYLLSNDVITLWLGDKYTISKLNVFLISMSFYFMNYRMIGWNFISVYGLARYMKIFSINEMIANVLFTLVFLCVFRLKLTGILLGTIVSTLLTVTWQDPYVIFHHAFNSSIVEYMKKYFYNFFILIVEIICLEYMSNLLRALCSSTVLHFFLLSFFIVIVSILVPYLFYIKSFEVKYFNSILTKVLRRS